MVKRQSKSQPTWMDVKAKLADFDQAGLVDLVHDLYAAQKDNQAFLHARFGLGEDVLAPYKKTIDRWLWPDVFRNQNTSVSKSKQAISDYKKAVGDPEGLAELMVFYCEKASGFCSDVGNEDEVYFDSLLRMFETSPQACQYTTSQSEGRPCRQAGPRARNQSSVWLWRRRWDGFPPVEVHEALRLMVRGSLITVNCDSSLL